VDALFSGAVLKVRHVRGEEGVREGDSL